MLAVSRRPGDELIWEQLLPEGHLKEEYTRLAESGGTFAQLLNSDEPVISKPVFCPYRVMGCRVRDRDGSIGIVVLVEVEPFRDEDAELLIIICKAVLFEMLYRERTARALPSAEPHISKDHAAHCDQEHRSSQLPVSLFYARYGHAFAAGLSILHNLR